MGLDGIAFDATGRLWARDRALGRVTVFGVGSGRVADILRLPFPPRVIPWRPTFLGERYLDWELDRDSLSAGVTRYRLRSIEPDQPDADTIVLRFAEDYIPGTLLRRPHGPTLEFAVDETGAIWYGITDRPEVSIHGRADSRIVLDLDRIEVPGDEARRVARGWAPDVGSSPRVSPGDVATHYPPILRIFPAADEPRIAVLGRSASASSGQTLIVLGDAVQVAFDLPITIERTPIPVLHGDRLFGVALDPRGAPRVVAIRLEAPVGGRGTR